MLLGWKEYFTWNYTNKELVFRNKDYYLIQNNCYHEVVYEEAHTSDNLDYLKLENIFLSLNI